MPAFSRLALDENLRTLNGVFLNARGINAAWIAATQSMLKSATSPATPRFPPDEEERLLEQIPLIAAWLAYFALHSLLASHRAKRFAQQRFPALFPRYRLFFNLVALAALLPALMLIWRQPGEMLWQWRGLGQWLMNLLALAGVAGFLYSTRYYDGATFLGLRANQDGHIGSADEPLVISPLHRFVRHPWYFFGLLLIWTRDMNSAWLITCLLVTLYFLIGSRLEENKLIAEYGDGYAEYRRRVGGIIPLPWKILSASEARDIMRQPA